MRVVCFICIANFFDKERFIMYHRYNLEAPDFAEHYDVWWGIMRRWFPNYCKLPLEKRIAAKMVIDAMVGAL